MSFTRFCHRLWISWDKLRYFTLNFVFILLSEDYGVLVTQPQHVLKLRNLNFKVRLKLLWIKDQYLTSNFYQLFLFILSFVSFFYVTSMQWDDNLLSKKKMRDIIIPFSKFPALTLCVSAGDKKPTKDYQ